MTGWDKFKFFYSKHVGLVTALIVVAFIIIVLLILFIIWYIMGRTRKKEVRPKKKVAKVKDDEPRSVMPMLLAMIVLIILVLGGILYYLMSQMPGLEETPNYEIEEPVIDKVPGETTEVPTTPETPEEPQEIIPDEEPSFTYQIWEEGTSLTINLSETFQDPDGDPLYFTSTQPDSITVEINEDIATLIPEEAFVGKRTIMFTATDGKGGYVDSPEITLVVLPEGSEYLSEGHEDTESSQEEAGESSFKIYVFYGALIIIVLIVLFILVKTSKEEKEPELFLNMDNNGKKKKK